MSSPGRTQISPSSPSGGDHLHPADSFSHVPFALMQLFRIDHAAMIAVGVWTGSLLAAGWADPLSIFPGIFVQAAAFSLNDYYDYETDKLNKRVDRPLVRGALSRSTALLLSIVLFLLAFFTSLLYPPLCRLLVVGAIVLSIAYSVSLKNLPLVGNLYIASSMAMPFLFGSLLADVLDNTVVVIAFTAFTAGLGREIAKTVQDMEGDERARGADTLPLFIGAYPSLLISLLCYVLATVLAVGLFLFLSPPLSAWVLLVIGCSVLLIAGFLPFLARYVHLSLSDALARARTLSLVGTFVALLSFLVVSLLPFVSVGGDLL